jgi:hypothetical protein
MSKQQYKTLRLKGTCPIAYAAAKFEGDYTKAKNNLVKKFADSGLTLKDFDKKKDAVKLLGEDENDYTFVYNARIKAEAADKIIASGNPLFVADVTDNPDRPLETAASREYRELKVTDNDADAAQEMMMFDFPNYIGNRLLDKFNSVGLKQGDFDLRHDPIRLVSETPDAKGDFSYVIRVTKDAAEKLQKSGDPSVGSDVTSCPEKFPGVKPAFGNVIVL